MLNVLAIARCCSTVLASEGVNGADDETALLQEELDLLHERLRRVPGRRRPYYTPVERMRILELKALRGWNHQEVADRFLVTPVTIASWLGRCDEHKDLVKIRVPVNKLADFVRYAAQRLKLFCPRLGKVKIAEILCRAGIEISATSVGRILREPTAHAPEEAQARPTRRRPRRKPDDVWHVDLTAVPTRGCGFWLPWSPHAVVQSWPFCWWIAAVVDSASRRCHGFAVFRKRPTSEQIRRFLGRAIGHVGRAPRILISDRERQFNCAAFARWTDRHSIDHRFGAVGRKGSIAVIERFFLSLKNECTRRLWVPLRHASFRRELSFYVEWFNDHRPHSSLEGRTPNEVYFARDGRSEEPTGQVVAIEAFQSRPNLPIVRLVSAA